MLSISCNRYVEISGSTVYRYDGQKGVEDVEANGSGVWQKTTDYALGARGVEAISVTTGSGTQVSYPLYDAHGNMISILTKQGTGGYQFSALRTFDAWGNIRLGAQTGDPKGRYCANLGHKQDDESGLVYMRARYYEPGSGRFISEDPGARTGNWYIFSNNDPVGMADASGRDFGDIDQLIEDLSKWSEYSNWQDAFIFLSEKIAQITERLECLKGEAFDALERERTLLEKAESDPDGFDAAEINMRLEVLNDAKASGNYLLDMYTVLKASFEDTMRDILELMEQKWG